MDTLLLDQNDWDLLLDAQGNIAFARSPYALAQDVASAIKLYQGELWYDQSKGVPYAQFLGHLPPAALLSAEWQAAALSVPDVVSAEVSLGSFEGRELLGSVAITDLTGVTTRVRI